MNFIVAEMTFLRYFIPLIIEGNKRKILSTIYIKPCGKYSCPIKNSVLLQQLSGEYKFNIKHISELCFSKQPVFSIEGVGLEHATLEQKKYVIPYMMDFTSRFNLYLDQTDHIIFPSKFIANYYDVESEKNLYLGSPKYDLSYNRKDILNKYNIQDCEKIALLASPRTRDLHKIDLNKIYDYLRRENYKIIVKTRGKDPVAESLRGDKYVVDFSWYPHDTLELLHISDVLINFGSTTIEEAAFMNIPVIDFDIKPKTVIRAYEFLCEEKTCAVLSPDVSYEDFSFHLNKLLSLNLEDEYANIRKKYFLDGNASSRILKVL